jgi:F-type H+-transporting ATPase subunit gamma
MASLRDIKKRIRAVESTKQITKAMEMVAAARLRKAQMQIESYRPYAQKMQEMLSHLSDASGAVEHPYFEEREVHNSALVVFASDRGLCGSFNSNIFRRANQWMADHKDENPALVLVGKKANDFYKRRDYKILKRYSDFGGKLDIGRIREVTSSLSKMFIDGELDRIEFLYTAFLSLASTRISEMQFLPIVSEFSSDEEESSAREYIFEPDPSEIFKQLLPSYAVVQVQMAFAESLASEHATRMLAMGSATKNAGEMIEHLTLVRNKARQASITSELLEIVSGAEALNQ